MHTRATPFLFVCAALAACNGGGTADAGPSDSGASSDTGMAHDASAPDLGTAPDLGASPDLGTTPDPADDQPYTITGAGFGDNVPLDQLWLGGASGYIESTAVGHDVSTEPRWHSDTPGNGVTRITDSEAYSYGHAIEADALTAPDGPGGAPPWPGIFSAAYDTGHHFDRILLHYVVRWDDQSESIGVEPLMNEQWKMVRLGYSAGVSDADSPNVLLSNWIDQSTWGRQSGDTGTSWLDEGSMPRVGGGWYTVELEVVVNAPLATANGTFHLRVRRTSDGVVTYDHVLEDLQYIAPSDPNGYFQWIVFQNYQGNLNQGYGAEPERNPTRTMMDDVYVLTGGTGAHVVLANAAQWADVTHEEIQAFDSWSDGSIHIPHLNLGTFPSAAGLYFYVKTSPSDVLSSDGRPL